jgi:hypothetical protein
MLSYSLTGVLGLDNDADIFRAVERALHGERGQDACDVQLGIIGVGDLVYRVFLLSEPECSKASSALENLGLVQLPGTGSYRALFRLGTGTAAQLPVLDG